MFAYLIIGEYSQCVVVLREQLGGCKWLMALLRVPRFYVALNRFSSFRRFVATLDEPGRAY